MLSRRVVSFNYILTGPKGDVLDRSEAGEPLAFLEGSGQIIPALETELLTLKVGDKKKVSLKASDAYGEHSEKMIVEVPKQEVAHLQIEVGAYLQLDLGENGRRVVRVTKMDDNSVTLDGNHPLAGQDLTFDVEVAAIRPATNEEIAHGHAHGPGGHHHH
ncbi:MAG: peptidylprolyl isomerase [Pseudobdellovibrionaceae bacterium]